jgi:hypothetical protein
VSTTVLPCETPSQGPGRKTSSRRQNWARVRLSKTERYRVSFKGVHDLLVQGHFTSPTSVHLTRAEHVTARPIGRPTGSSASQKWTHRHWSRLRVSWTLQSEGIMLPRTAWPYGCSSTSRPLWTLVSPLTAFLFAGKTFFVFFVLFRLLVKLHYVKTWAPLLSAMILSHSRSLGPCAAARVISAPSISQIL